MIRRLAALSILVAAVGLGFDGLWRVEPGERLVVRRFGRLLDEPWGPGPRWVWPFGVERVERVRVDAVRRLEIGVADDRTEPAEFLTTDRNLLRARAVVSYRVADPIAFHRVAASVEGILARATQAYLAAALAERTVEDVLGAGRADVAAAVGAAIADRAAACGLGVAILGVGLVALEPPTEVAADFAAAQAAGADRDRRVQEAETAAVTLRSRAEADARDIQARAEADAQRIVADARARADSFRAVHAEVQSHRDLAMRRIYFDAVAELLARPKRRVIVGDGQTIDLTILGSEAEPP